MAERNNKQHDKGGTIISAGIYVEDQLTNQARLWPEGEVFTRKVLIPTNYDPLPVEVVYIVPPFEVVVALWQNKEHEKTYPLFRQFIQD
jgi:hypothetical protein